MQRNLIDKLPKDVNEVITNNLSPADFVKFCTNNYSVCNSNDVFTRRIVKDFPFIKNMSNDWNTNSKIRYLETFTEISSEAERLTEKVLATFRNVAKYLAPQYKEDVYIYLFQTLKDSIQQVSDEKTNIDEIYEFLLENYIDNFQWKFIPPDAQDDDRNYFWSDFFSDNTETFLHKFFND